MVCKSTCILAGALLGGFMFTSLLSMQIDRAGSPLKQTLSPTQLQKFEEIVTIRRKLATHGFLLGMLLSLGYVLYRYFGQSKSFTITPVVCNVIAITLATTWAYYTLSPKKDHMIRYLTTPNQVDLFLEKSRAYQLRWAGGLILGAAGAYFLGRGLVENDNVE